MAVFNYAKREIDAKIVYYGPAISGKTTNLQFIHQHLKPDQRGKMVSLATNEDRTLFFDFLPIELESVRGFKTRFHLYTVPGQVYYGATRRAVLTGADGLVFVADSHAERMADNLASLKDLEDNLKYYGKKVETIPLVMQYNKRDLPDVVPLEELNEKLNRLSSPSFESVAVVGTGVFETLTMACRLVLKGIENGAGSRRGAAPPAKEPALRKSAAAPVQDPAPGPAPSKPTPPPLAGKNAAPEPPLTKSTPPEKRSVPLRPPGPPKDLLIAKESTPRIAPAKSTPPEKGAAPLVRPAGLAEKPASVEKEEPEVKPLPVPPEKLRPQAPIQAKGSVQGKRLEASFILESRSEKKDLHAKNKWRVLSCGQARVSPGEVEIPLTLEMEGGAQSVPLQMNLSIKLEAIGSKVD